MSMLRRNADFLRGMTDGAIDARSLRCSPRVRDDEDSDYARGYRKGWDKVRSGLCKRRAR